MRRDQFEHVIKAAADIVKDEIVVVGSQSVLGQFPNAPASLLRSQEVDVYPKSNPDCSQNIDGAIGDGSRFHETYGYYAHGVGPETVVAPVGWQGRLTKIELPALRKRDGTVVAWCLDVHDLLLAKLAAGRPHDYTFVEDAMREGLVELEQLRLGVDLLPDGDRGRVRDRLEMVVARLRGDRSSETTAPSDS